jgi:hypothetical protein
MWLVASAGAPSETGRQFAPASVDFQMPPVAEAIRSVDSSKGWIAIAETRPATIPHRWVDPAMDWAGFGPTACHRRPPKL